jgi:hypothetical protein
MGRPSCSSCCKVVVLPQKKGCVDRAYKVYYKYGAGGWKTSNEYEDYLKNIPINIEVGIKVYYPIGSEDVYIVDEIIEGEGQEPTKVKLRDKAVAVDISEVEPVRNAAGFKSLQEIKYVSSKSDYGEYASYLNCWNFPKAFFEEGETIDEIDEEFQAGNPNYGVHIPKFWVITLGDDDEKKIVVTKQLSGKKNYAYFSVSGLDRQWFPSGHNWYSWKDWPKYFPRDYWTQAEPSDFSYETTTYVAVWTTDIYYRGKQIFYGSKCIPYKKEYRLYNFGSPTTAEVYTHNILRFLGSPIYELDPYANFNYCLTFPFFTQSTDATFIDPRQRQATGFSTVISRVNGHTHYFHSGEDCNVVGPPDGTIEDNDIEFYHADKGLFTKISVESKDFIVFNPYSEGEELGREVTDDELAEYKGDTLKEQEELVDTPLFQYVDNKIRIESDLPQYIIAEDEPLEGMVEFPEGWPRIDGEPGKSVETFKEYMEKGREEVIFVSFRTKRGADASGIDIEEGMEVYHPVGSDDKYTITDIIEWGPDTKPTKVKLSNGSVVNVSEIELLQDALYYAMNERTYYLQLIYLKSLGGDFYNPFKYRVTRIDFTNPDIDIDCIGDEISGHPNMVDIEVGIKVLYPIGEVDDQGDEIVPDEYTIDRIVERGEDDKPTKVRLNNDSAAYDGEVVDVSDIEPINPNENPTYITITQDYSWGKIDKDKKKKGSYLRLSEENPITLDLDDPVPMSLKDDIVLTGPVHFTYNLKSSDNNIFASFDKLYPAEDSWTINFPETTGETQDFLFNIDDGSEVVWFTNKQLPKSGYFFGNFVNLTFYLQEIDEWKNEQI